MAERPSETVLVHLYRGEVARSDTWRTRLDNTSNWALTTAAAVISFSFASPAASHAILLVGGFLIWTFLLVEARRYRYYDLWIRRVRLLEDGFVASILRSEAPDPDLLHELAELITRPRLTVSIWDAVGLRLRRVYAAILFVLGLAWLVKIGMHPTMAHSFRAAVDRSHVGPIPGAFVLTLSIVAAVATVYLWARSFTRPLPSGELQSRRRGRRPLSAIFGV
jgi:uncharacterized membrane protein